MNQVRELQRLVAERYGVRWEIEVATSFPVPWESTLDEPGPDSN